MAECRRSTTERRTLNVESRTSNVERQRLKVEGRKSKVECSSPNIECRSQSPTVAVKSRRTSDVRDECRTCGVTCGEGFDDSRRWRLSPTNLWKISKTCAILTTIDYCTNGGAYTRTVLCTYDIQITKFDLPSDSVNSGCDVAHITIVEPKRPVRLPAILRCRARGTRPRTTGPRAMRPRGITRS